MSFANPDDAVLRAAGQVPAIVDACLALHSPALWTQEAFNAEAAAHARQTPTGQR